VLPLKNIATHIMIAGKINLFVIQEHINVHTIVNPNVRIGKFVLKIKFVKQIKVDIFVMMRPIVNQDKFVTININANSIIAIQLAKNGKPVTQTENA
jgi:hypothetical protein